jgi:hypothetical protein
MEGTRGRAHPIRLAMEVAMLVPDDPQKAVEIISEILQAISRVKYYGPKSPSPAQPRVTKRPHDKWCSGRWEKLMNA